MGKLPQISGQELCRALEKEGFVFVRQTGSHRIYQKQTEEGALTIPIPVHSNKSLKKGTLHNILKKAGISREKLAFLFALLMH
ncbi:MAG: type II toxin-antitoxin system HicA family toxin [Deltaproteobacteria bacterium]